jgi:hypothetical protein
MTDIRPAIAEQTAALARLHNTSGDWCDTCNEPAPCDAAGLLGEVDDRLSRRLAGHTTEETA